MKLTPAQKRTRIKLATTALILLSWLVLYLLGSFTVWSWNPGSWNETWRGLLFALGIIVTVFWILCALESIDNLKYA